MTGMSWDEKFDLLEKVIDKFHRFLSSKVSLPEYLVKAALEEFESMLVKITLSEIKKSSKDYYVYGYFDPIQSKMIYIGKGKKRKGSFPYQIF